MRFEAQQRAIAHFEIQAQAMGKKSGHTNGKAPQQRSVIPSMAEFLASQGLA